jgi:uncharacterized C2H2 Zn-finger protein
MAVTKAETFEPVTMGHIRAHGCRDLLVYCGSINCSHGTTLNADHMPDDTPIRPLGARMVCSRCGYRGADVRPDWGPHVNKRHVYDHGRTEARNGNTDYAWLVWRAGTRARRKSAGTAEEILEAAHASTAQPTVGGAGMSAAGES